MNNKKSDVVYKLKVEETKIDGLYQSMLQKMKFENELPYRKLVIKYRQRVLAEIKKYKPEFRQYFKKNDRALIATDAEEFKAGFGMFCFFIIIINPDLTFNLQFFTVDHPKKIESSGGKIEFCVKNWLEKQKNGFILSHGGRLKEKKLVSSCGHSHADTQSILKKLRDKNPKYALGITGNGLRHFEKYIGFERKYCSFFKHDISKPLFRKQSTISLYHHFSNNPQEICEVCNKREDVIGYCMEDALSCLLIFILNYNISINPQKDLKVVRRSPKRKKKRVLKLK